MLLSHARALAHTEIYRGSNPLVTYHKDAVVPDEMADDWEPNQSPPTEESAPQPVAAAVSAVMEEESVPYDCGCGTVATAPTGG